MNVGYVKLPGFSCVSLVASPPLWKYLPTPLVGNPIIKILDTPLISGNKTVKLNFLKAFKFALPLLILLLRP